MKYTFDTNVFRDIQQGKITHEQVLRAKDRLRASQEVAYVAPIVLLELGSHLIEEERKYFFEIRDAFRAVRLLCSEGLGIPEEYLREIAFGDTSLSTELGPLATRNLCLMVASAENYDDVYRPRAVAWDGGVSIRAFYKDFLPLHRLKIENDYVQMMNDWIALAIPDHEEKRRQGKIVSMEPGPDRDALLAFFRSDDHLEQLSRSQAIRFKAKIRDDSREFYLAAAKKMLSYLEAINYIYRESLTAGYNIAKNKNDLSDIHFLAYLADPEMVLVTGDRGVRNKISRSNPQLKQIVFTSDWFE